MQPRRNNLAAASAVTWRDAFSGRQRWILGGLVLLIVVALVATFGWRTVQQRVAATQAAASSPGAAPGPIGAGSSSALPFGKGDARPQPSRGLADLPEDELRAAYLAAKDKSSVYQSLRERPEPEAKYLAYRAASDCAGALGGARDASDIDQMVRQATERAAGSAESANQRRAAASELAASCRGFLQPGAIPEADMQRLLGEAASGGHMAAQAALRTAQTDQYALVTKAIRSGDTLALADAITPLLRLANSHRIAGIDVSSKDVMAVRLGIEVAGCRISSTCGAGSTRALAECAYTGICEAASPADMLLGSPTLTSAQRDMARSIAEQIERAWQKRDVASIIAPRR